ncbi:hypothetical protein ACTJJ0_29005 [Chitinophaga sp. 22321]|uniref:Uncharacterized protein n=1 Tax=Chitinophaga hostae TaxID=2831022 RepID=A0ABS5J7K0_9BACT|nr:hypothetical protein [Chitinophaga hostae]MBS0031033.1 hypothetical protein [Chitinophaga hostae]
MMKKAIIKRFLVYFLLRDIPLMLIVCSIIGAESTSDVIRTLLSAWLPLILIYFPPVILLNALLFGWAYVYLLKQFTEKRSPVYVGYGLGLLMLEALLLKISFYEDIHWLVVFFIFVYLVVFTGIYFRKVLTQGDKALWR